jgi:hypothetical protein
VSMRFEYRKSGCPDAVEFKERGEDWYRKF